MGVQKLTPILTPDPHLKIFNIDLARAIIDDHFPQIPQLVALRTKAMEISGFGRFALSFGIRNVSRPPSRRHQGQGAEKRTEEKRGAR